MSRSQLKKKQINHDESHLEIRKFVLINRSVAIMFGALSEFAYAQATHYNLKGKRSFPSG